MEVTIGNVWSALLVGGASPDIAARCMHPTVLASGYYECVREHVARAKAFGASNVVVLNPGGTDAGEMQFDQWLLAWPDVRERAKRAIDFQRAIGHASAAFRRKPAVYLGSVHPRCFPAWSALSREELAYAVCECVSFIPRGCRVVIDMAGVDVDENDKLSDSASERVAYALYGAGMGIACEPWPSQDSTFNADDRSMGFTNSAYLRQILSMDDSGGGQHGREIDRSPSVANRQVAIIAEAVEPSPEELIGWLAIGIGVAVNPGADGKYHGYTAEELRSEARGVAIKAVK